MSGLIFQRAWLCRLVPLILWLCVIFVFSEIPGSGSTAEPPLWYVLERKSAHVFEYAVLALLAYRFLAVLFPRVRFEWLSFLVLLFALTAGALDEYHQSFVFGRGARISDVAVDGIGALLALTALFFMRRRR